MYRKISNDHTENSHQPYSQFTLLFTSDLNMAHLLTISEPTLIIIN